MGLLARVWYAMMLSLAKGVFWLIGGIRASNRAFMPKRGGVIVAPAHFSFLDPPVVACGCTRQLRFMAKEELFEVPIFGPLIRSLRAFPIKRGESDLEAIKQAIKFVKDGDALLIFPEGTRGDGKTLGEVNRGVTMLAKRTGAPVLPVGLSGTHLALPKGAKKIRRQRIRMVFGEPFTYEEAAESAPQGIDPRDWFAKVLEARLIDLCGEAGLELKNARSIVQTTVSPRSKSPNEQPENA